MESKKETNFVERYFFLAIIILFSVAMLWSLLDFFTAFLGAVMFYVLSKPLIDLLLRRWKWKKSTVATLVIVISFFIILLPIGLFAAMLYQKIAFVARNPAELVKPIRHLGDVIEQKYHINIISSSIGSIQDFATNMVSSILNSSFNFFTTISMMYFFLYFMIVTNIRMEAALVLFLPFKRSQVMLFGDELKAQTVSNSVGVPLIAVVHGLLAFTAYYIANAADPVFWAIITGFASIIPLIGTALVWVPMAGYLLAQGHNWQCFFVLGWGAIVIGSSDNLIRFLLAKKMANIHPIVTVLGVIIGLRYFGIPGLIFGPLMISYLLILMRIYYMEYKKPVATKQMGA
ncbi:AI-2E family transporter [Parasediminibacterium sp. JCM 36343]|uniref:AI-2E family transporter n=1 Tax=Parasediminibacterium sp. JCM 36343 TaxID=3374279 RepID=UPI00397BFEE4